MSQQIKFNISCIEYALINNLHVEYFIQCYLKLINTSGIYNINELRINYDDKKIYLASLKSFFYDKFLFDLRLKSSNEKQNELDAKLNTLNLLKNNCFKKYSFEAHLMNNIFFSIKDDKIYIKNNKKYAIEKTSFSFVCDFDEATFMAQKEATYSKNLLCGWNDTLIKYFFIAIYACKYQHKKPYALNLISNDLQISISTIQKAIKTFEVQRSHKRQDKKSFRSYYENGQRVNLSPNYMNMSFGVFSTSVKKTRIH